MLSHCPAGAHLTRAKLTLIPRHPQPLGLGHREHAARGQAVDGLSEVFSNGADHDRQDRETEVRDLHAKIGQLTVERDFLSRGLKR